MKMILKIRSFLQLLAFLSVLMIFGAAGAWENGSINFLQFLLETVMLFGASCFFAQMSKQRIILRLLPRTIRVRRRSRHNVAVHSEQRTVHAA